MNAAYKIYAYFQKRVNILLELVLGATKPISKRSHKLPQTEMQFSWREKRSNVELSYGQTPPKRPTP